MNKITILSANGIIAIMIISVFSASFADELPSDSQITPLDGNIGVEKTVLTFSVPDNNDLPWAFVEGKISNPVLDYPVIIQIYDNDDQVVGNNVGAVHFAQTDVENTEIIIIAIIPFTESIVILSNIVTFFVVF